MALTKITSNQVTYNQGGTDSVVRNLQGKLQESVSVLDFMTAAEIAGCVDGSVDVTDAVQAAITAASSVYFPAGIYQIIGTLTLKSSVILHGDGIASVITSSYAGDILSLQGATSYGNKSHVVVHDMKLIRTSASGDFIDLKYTDNITIENVTCTGSTATGYLRFTACRYVSIKNCFGTSFASVAFLEDGANNTQYVEMEGGRFTGASQGITATGLQYATFKGVTSDSHVVALGGTYGVGFDFEGVAVKNVKVIGCIAHSCQVAGFYVEGTGANGCRNIEFIGCTAYGTVAGPGINLEQNFTEIKIIGGEFYSNTGNGISGFGNNHVLIDGVTCRNNTSDGIEYSDLYYSTIIGCDLRDNGAYGINLTGTVSGAFVALNTFDSNVSGTITGGVNAGSYEEGTWTPSPTGLTVVGTPTYEGRYTRIGRMVFGNLLISSTTSTASTIDTTYFSGLPYSVNKNSTCQAVQLSGTVTSLGIGALSSTNSRLYPPTWSANSNTAISFFYEV